MAETYDSLGSSQAAPATFRQLGQSVAPPVGAFGGGSGVAYFGIVAADYAVTGKTPKLRLTARAASGDNIPVASLLFGLNAASFTTGATAATSSVAATIAASAITLTPVADSVVTVTKEFDFSTVPDGLYCMTIAWTGTTAANSGFWFGTRLHVHVV